MPDTRDAANAAINTQDLRSPDTRDVAAGHFAPADVSVPSHPAPVASSGDSRWPDFGIALLAVAMIGAAVAVFVMVRRRSGGLVTAMADGTRDWRRGVGL